jgi:hypothetical protein
MLKIANPPDVRLFVGRWIERKRMSLFLAL